MLVVERDTHVARVMREVLSRAGYATVTVPDPAEALSVAGELETIDTVVVEVDSVTSGGPADEVAGIQELHPTARVVVTLGQGPLLSDQWCPDDVVFLPKPFGPRQLVEAIRRSPPPSQEWFATRG